MKSEREIDTMSGVNISGLGIRFGATKVISGLDLEVNEGEFLVLLGPSGCGKSTLLHGIAGLIEVNEGRIDIGGQDMTRAEPAERGIGMVFQSYALYPNMTVERNMSFGLRVARLPRAEIARRVDRAAKMLQLEPLLKRKPAQLSGGQRQRVAIGRALVREARVFLFDEPLSNLDAKLRAELRRELKLLHQTLGATMVYVTHDQVEAMTLATRIVVMQGGLIQQIGTPAEVYERPANLFVAGFLGSPGMNLLRTRIVAPDGAGLRSEGPLSISLNRYAFVQTPGESQEVFMGVRPEHIKVVETGRWSATVELFEPMGNHQVLWLRMDDGTAISAVVHELHSPVVGARLSFDIEEGLVSLFDVNTERRL